MTAIVLPDIDKSTIEELKKRMPDLTEIELPNLPSMKKVSKTTDQTIDRLLGRSRTPAWPWIAAGIGLVAVIGVVAAWFAWFRRPTWQAQPEPWTEQADDAPAQSSSMSESTTYEPTTYKTASDDLQPVMDEKRSTVGSGKRSSSGTGLTAAESSLSSTPYPIEEA
jgi:hypothetical protein